MDEDDPPPSVVKKIICAWGQWKPTRFGNESSNANARSSQNRLFTRLEHTNYM
jgi:hypothetical protein